MTAQTAQYLVVIYALEQCLDPPIRSGRVARAVERSPSATTEMIQRLADAGLVEHEPYVGVELTAAGRDRASELYDTHAILCRFFREVLDLDDYAREALALAGVVDCEIAERLARTVLPTADVGSTPSCLLPPPDSPPGEPHPDTSPDR